MIRAILKEFVASSLKFKLNKLPELKLVEFQVKVCRR